MLETERASPKVIYPGLAWLTSSRPFKTMARPHSYRGSYHNTNSNPCKIVEATGK